MTGIWVHHCGIRRCPQFMCFDRMAEHMLEGERLPNARRVQLRFNNLGLSTRQMRKAQGTRGPKGK